MLNPIKKTITRFVLFTLLIYASSVGAQDKSTLYWIDAHDRIVPNLLDDEEEISDWDVRAIYIPEYGVIEFDEYGVFYWHKNGAIETGRLFELWYVDYFGVTGENEGFLWQSEKRERVFYPILSSDQISINQSDDLPPEKVLSLDVALINLYAATGFTACPARQVESDKSDFIDGHKINYFDDRCEQAISYQDDYGQTYWSYPDDEKLKWQIQYFSDPITPILDEVGRCLLYCAFEDESARMEQNANTPNSGEDVRI